MTGIKRVATAWGPALPLLALAAFLLVSPLVVLVLRSFSTSTGFGLDAWSRVLGQSVNQRAIVSSVAISLLCATVSTLVGTPIAWLITRMLPGRRAAWLGLLNVAAHFGGVGLAFAYVATLGSLGMLTLVFQGLGLPFIPPPRASAGALMIVYAYSSVPFFVLLTIPAMGILREDWREAAETSAATPWQFWRRVGLPVLAPFVAAGFVLQFTWAMGVYAVPYSLVGQTAGRPVELITLQIGTALEDVVNGPSRAAVLSVVLVIIGAASLITYRALARRGLRWLGRGALPPDRRRGNLQPASAGAGRGGLAGFRPGSIGRTFLFGGALFYLAVPMVAVVLYSVATRWTAHVLPDGYTLEWWSLVAGDDGVRRAISTSLILGAATAAIDTLIVVPALYWARVRNPRIRPALDLAAAIPLALPFLVIAVAILQFAGVVAPFLQGTFALLVLGSCAVCFPFVYWAVDGAMAAASIERLSEAAESCGASPLQIVRRVVLPNVGPGVASGAVLCIATAFGELALVQMLASSVNTVATWSATALRETNPKVGIFSELAVVTTVMFVLLLGVSFVVVRGRGARANVIPGVPIGAQAAASVADAAPAMAGLPDPAGAGL